MRAASAVAGNGKLAENTRHFFLHVTIWRRSGNWWRNGFVFLLLFRGGGNGRFIVRIPALGYLRFQKALEIAGQLIGKFRLSVVGRKSWTFRFRRKGGRRCILLGLEAGKNPLARRIEKISGAGLVEHRLARGKNGWSDNRGPFFFHLCLTRLCRHWRCDRYGCLYWSGHERLCATRFAAFAGHVERCGGGRQNGSCRSWGNRC